jgi:hypothetical protein
LGFCFSFLYVKITLKVYIASDNTAEKRLRMRGHKKDGEEFICQIVNKNMESRRIVEYRT